MRRALLLLTTVVIALVGGVTPVSARAADDVGVLDVRIADGWYTVQARHSGKCLDVYRSSTADRANVQQYTCNTTSNQIWYFRLKLYATNVYHYEVRALHSDKCLDVEGPSVADGANVHQFGCRDTSNQRWLLFPSGAVGYYEIRAFHSDKCLDVYRSLTTNGTNVQQYTCRGTNNQFWRLTRFA